MQGRGLDGRAHDLKTIAKHTTRKAWFDEVWDAEVEAAAAEGLLLLTCAHGSLWRRTEHLIGRSGGASKWRLKEERLARSRFRFRRRWSCSALLRCV